MFVVVLKRGQCSGEREAKETDVESAELIMDPLENDETVPFSLLVWNNANSRLYELLFEEKSSRDTVMGGNLSNTVSGLVVHTSL